MDQSCIVYEKKCFGDEIYAVYYGYEGDHTQPFRYFIGCRVTDNDEIPDGMDRLTIPGGTFQKITAIVIAVLVTIPLISAIFVDRDYAVERSVVIDKPKEEVFEYIRYLRNQNSYSVWASMDPDMRVETRGTDGTVGFVSAWEGNEDVIHILLRSITRSENEID